MRRFCGHEEALAPGASARAADIAAGEECSACMQAAVERDVAAGRRPSRTAEQLSVSTGQTDSKWSERKIS